ncbi:MAG: hypothetical protein UY41_C0018G0022 [Candidatus Moranbacteria bacterium GW2011_GWE1_49_15]|nr:MAG: hypothetical protein UX75_C0040G0002 [Candidatus Moranbacteria bacterium GW2011_GWE2_47_10]KKW06664.1 MAG: hypothetical protein UY41_C0018G0022 [Candidatus Moranbacteria bacterium GW2011_GWE1_49_15]HBP00718.1 hypothetical protein [Candidatus Moranbacteria bacterium]
MKREEQEKIVVCLREGLFYVIMIGEKLADPDSLTSEERKEFMEFLRSLDLADLTRVIQLWFGAGILSRSNIREHLEKSFGEEDARAILDRLSEDEERHIRAQERQETLIEG